MCNSGRSLSEDSCELELRDIVDYTVLGYYRGVEEPLNTKEEPNVRYGL